MLRRAEESKRQKVQMQQEQQLRQQQQQQQQQQLEGQAEKQADASKVSASSPCSQPSVHSQAQPTAIEGDSNYTVRGAIEGGSFDVRQCANYSEDEQQVKRKLVAMGFPPEIAARAASAYPTNLSRATEWVLEGVDW
jgi:hypothetical protein